MTVTGDFHDDGKDTSSLRPVPSPSGAASDDNSPTSINSSGELAHERQTLLLMLLGQVCSLHDATPRTFVVHVIALYERGILDSNSIRFLFDLGLVPRGFGYDLNKIVNGGDEGVAADMNGQSISQPENQGAIIPYSENSIQYPWN